MTTVQEHAIVQAETDGQVYPLEETLNGGIPMANSETIMLSIKFVMFLALEVFVLAVMAAVLTAGLYQFIRNKVRKLRAAPAAKEAAIRS